MNQLMQYLIKNQPSLWNSLPPITRSWIENLQEGTFVDTLTKACKESSSAVNVENKLLREYINNNGEDDSAPSPTNFFKPRASDEPDKKTNSFWTWAGGITMLIFVILLVFGGGVEKALGVDIPFVPFFTTLQTPQTETVVEEVVTSTTNINGELVVKGCQLVTFDENGWPNWVAKNEDGFAVPTASLPNLTANPQKICLSDLTAWQSFITSGNSDQTAGQWLANKICKASGYNDPKCDDAIVAAFQSAKKLKVEPTVVDGVEYPYQRQAGIFTLPAWPPGSNNQSSTSSEVTDSSALGGDPSSGDDPNTGSSQEDQGEEAPQTTEVAQTPYPTFTATTDSIATAQAAPGGLTQLDPINLSDLINKTGKGLGIWNLPNIQSVEIKFYWDGKQDWIMAWAPSYSQAVWTFRLLDSDQLSQLASQAGCSSFVLEGTIIYEQKVSDQLTFVRNDLSGVAKYMFPAGQTSVFGCYVWPTATPVPTSTPQPTSPPVAPTYTPVPTATATNYVSECNLTLSWQSLINNPGQVTGSGNSYLVKHTAQDPNNRVYVGNVTEYSVKYCLTGLPNQINGAAWNQQYISLTGQLYGGSGECNISGTDIWVANCWK